MRTPGSTLLLAAIFGVLAAGPVLAAAAPDLTKIDRRIAKEPKYIAKQPLYGLYVFGPEAKTRVWAVLDKSKADAAAYDVLYFDRNANGDLTAPEDRIVGQGNGGGVTFDIGSLTDKATGDTHTEIKISRRTENDGTMFLSMKWKGKHDVWGGYAPVPGPYTVFATSAKEAPILWPGADGPLTFQPWMWEKIPIGGQQDLRVFLGHAGVGKNTFCGLSQSFLPAGGKVLATLIYTDREGKEHRVAHELTDRC
jgi:hypothetical protein